MSSSCLTFILAALFTQAVATRSPRAGYLCPTAVFTFADSLCEGGNRDIEAGHRTLSSRYPYGITFGRATGRYADGLILTDFLVQKLHLNNVDLPSLAYNGSEFVSLNFAYAGATVIPVENQPFSSPHVLSTQVDDFVRHREMVVGRYGLERSRQWYNDALYVIEIGGDDFNFALPQGTSYLANITTPAVIRGLRDSILRLYDHGARHVVLFNMPRADCSPSYLQTFSTYPQGQFHYDEDGCIAEIAVLISGYNTNFRRLTEELTGNFSGLNVHYFDWFAANTYVIEHMEEHGFTNALQACCGGGGRYNCQGQGLCGCAPLTDANATYTVCKDPSKFVTFDGIHYTSRFYEIMANYIFSGTHVYPKLELEWGCKVIT